MIRSARADQNAFTGGCEPISPFARANEQSAQVSGRQNDRALPWNRETRIFSGHGPVLVVEDDGTIGEVLHTSLAQHGHEVAWHTCGRTALQDAAKQPCDLVLLDLDLSDVDGTEVSTRCVVRCRRA
ncbi:MULTISPECIES: response regulator [unclassified Amycolatopsis]|uniref:response regulator n=1 Tax=unclassified Amycolatopsis TaxID=2618356 RepID=UPI002105C99C|nr:response regulator [Amycolatopsis sp. DSM 110486]